MQCLVICPTEHIKCRLQAQTCPTYQHKLTEKIVTSPMEMTARVVKNHGVAGLYRGWNVTALREVPSFGLYFAAYDIIRDTLVESLPTIPNWTSSVVAGGISGALTWAIGEDTSFFSPSRQLASLAASLVANTNTRSSQFTLSTSSSRSSRPYP